VTRRGFAFGEAGLPRRTRRRDLRSVTVSVRKSILLLRSGAALGVIALVTSCGSDTLGVATTVVNVTPTNFATIPPVATTLPGPSTTLPPNAVGSEQIYVVQAGDSPIAVANKFNIALTTLLAYNGWVSPAQFPYPGSEIRIPAQAVVQPGTGAGTGTTPNSVAPGPVGPGCGTRPAGTYTVQRGDSMFSIKEKFCVSIASLLTANNWADTSQLILPGDVINIPAAGS
jgi:LysM repeat protein